jgi:hypothetical protein
MATNEEDPIVDKNEREGGRVRLTAAAMITDVG